MNLTKKLSGTAAGLLFSMMAAAYAGPITGTLSIDGQSTFTSTTVNFSGLGNVGPGTATGSYTPTFLPGCTSCVTEQSFNYNVNGAISPVQVYSVSIGSPVQTATFTINDIVSSNNSGGFLNVSATGFANLTGFDQTDGTFLFSTQGNGTIMTTFSALTTVVGGNPGGGPIPEPFSVAILGSGLLGLGLARRFRR